MYKELFEWARAEWCRYTHNIISWIGKLKKYRDALVYGTWKRHGFFQGLLERRQWSQSLKDGVEKAGVAEVTKPRDSQLSLLLAITAAATPVLFSTTRGSGGTACPSCSSLSCCRRGPMVDTIADTAHATFSRLGLPPPVVHEGREL